MANTKETLKFLTNVPEIITFQFDDFKTGKSQYGDWFMYGVENRGMDKIVFPSENLHNMFQTIGSLKGKTLEVVKYEDGNFKNWKISESGVDITPKVIKSVSQGNQQPSFPENNSPGLVELHKRLEKASQAFTALENRLNALEIRIGVLEMEVKEKK